MFYRLVPIFLLSILSSTVSFADQYDFRKTTWGMSKAQVKKTEKCENIKFEDKKGIIYQGTVSELDCLILYVFAERKLVRTKYEFSKPPFNLNNPILDYDRLKKTLTKKYGDPIRYGHFWDNDFYRKEYQNNQELAISAGLLFYLSEWETPTTKIRMRMDGENFKTTLAIQYQSKKLKELEYKVREKDALDKL